MFNVLGSASRVRVLRLHAKCRGEVRNETAQHSSVTCPWSASSAVAKPRLIHRRPKYFSSAVQNGESELLLVSAKSHVHTNFATESIAHEHL